MRFLNIAKDGGPDSNVTGFYFVEIKQWFSIILLRFSPGSRENYHNHAFNAVSWLLKGTLIESHLNGPVVVHTPSLLPFFTGHYVFHRVFSHGPSYALTFRGPWNAFWKEYTAKDNKYTVLTYGRKEVNETTSQLPT